MSPSQGIFSIKLYELEQEYGLMHSRLILYQEENHEKIEYEKQKILNECREKELMLQKQIENGRSELVKDLSEAQLSYCKKTREIIEKNIPEYFHDRKDYNNADYAEAMTLYAEYAIDFATQSMRHALLAAFSAIDLQMNNEETGKNK